MKKNLIIFTLTGFVLLILKLNFYSKELPLFITENTEVLSSDSLQNLLLQQKLDSLYSNKELGAIVSDNKTLFRIFAPEAEMVNLEVFVNVTDENSRSFRMIKDENGVWEVQVNENLCGKYYGFTVYSTEDIEKNITPNLCIDPYAKAVATYTDYLIPR